MKDLKFYKGASEKEIFNMFLETLQRSITGWDYFVDWEKVKNNVSDMYTELNILNSLVGSANIEEDFLSLCRKYPEVKKALPILIAVRKEKLKDLPIMENEKTLSVVEIDNLFDEKDIGYKGLHRFLRDSGLAQVFQDRKIKSLVDYVTGVEVGMDTNGRKNRTGVVMERIVEKRLKKIVEKRGFEYGRQMSVDQIKQRWGVVVPTDKSKRKFDFVVFNGEEPILFEVNFYRGGGTKLKATAGEYVELDNLMKKAGIKFVWVTDGLGWKSSHRSLEEAFLKNEHLFNLHMLSEGVLEEVL